MSPALRCGLRPIGYVHGDADDERVPVETARPVRLGIVNDYELVVRGTAALLAPYLAINLVTAPISSIPVVKRRLSRILLWAAVDTSARFAAITVGGAMESARAGMVLYSAVGTISGALYLAWMLRLSRVRVKTMLSDDWTTYVLAVGSASALIVLRGAVSLPVLVVLTASVSIVWALLAVRGLRS